MEQPNFIEAKKEEKPEKTEKMKATLDSKEPLPQIQEEISVNYTYTNPTTNIVEHQETITLSIEQKLQDFLSFYKKTNIDLPPDFEDTGKHLNDYNQNSSQWLPGSTSGSRLVYSSWDPSRHKLVVRASGPEVRFANLGVRPTRCFFWSIAIHTI